MEGNLADVLGGNIERKSNGTIHLTQPHLIDQILEDFCIKRDGIKPSSTLAFLLKLFSRHWNRPCLMSMGGVTFPR